MAFFNKLTRAGTSPGEDQPDRQGILLTNYVSLGLAFAVVILFIARFIFAQINRTTDEALPFAVVLSLLPILFNRLGWTTIARLSLCWLPPAFTIVIIIMALKTGFKAEASSFVGMRLFLLSFTCIPFIVFDFSRRTLLLLGLAGPLLGLMFFDPLLNAAGVGFWQMGLTDSGYAYNNVRAPVAFLVIAFSCYSLKKTVEQGRRINERLLEELKQKNEVIQSQAQTELHRLNEELQQKIQVLSEREFILSQSQQIAGIGSWEYRIEGAQHVWSDELYHILGLSKDIPVDTDRLMNVLPKDDIGLIISATNELLLTGNSYDVTLKTTLLQGQAARWLRVCAFPVQDGDKVVGARGICHDVTFYKNVEERISASERKYHSLFEQASDAIMITDFDGNFIDVNTGLCTMFGYSKDELLGMNISALIDPEQLKHSPMAMAPLKQGKHVFSERRMIRKNGAVVEVEANVKKFDEGSVMAIARDVTLRNAHERDLLNANSKIEELRLTALRAVMSPHFVFNVLNSVQFFIAKNDRENAIKYLSTFSKLVRNVLMQSMHAKIKLSDEIEMLRNYVDLEMTRFQGKFNFKFDVDPAIDVSDIEIPSLLIQPFVENAIIHGLYNKTEPGTLLIRIKEREGMLIFEVEDDGIGREAAMTLLHQNFPHHDSLGSKVTEERLHLIAQRHQVTFQIEDLKSNDGPLGTRVIIGIGI